jgi:ubiquitin C-terminal hydrolase
LENVQCSSQVCNKKQNLTASTIVAEFPKTLIIHLQRFHWSNEGRPVKRSNQVTFPLTGLSVNALNPNTSITYDLKAVISHLSSHTSFGHYIAHVHKNNEWILFDDHRIRYGLEKVCQNPNPVNQCQSTNAYVLVYTIHQ